MDNWTSGYVADIGYTFGYYAELNPLRTRLGLLNAGIEPPEIKHCCELGFGQGVSVNLHAAGNAASTWYGTDFNPAQASFAQALSASSGADAHLYDQAFAEFCARDDLPEFQYIGIHGIWSWISDANRQALVDFIGRKLAVGGILYISYNTLPGWSAAAPLRHLMAQHAETMTAPGQGMLNRIDGSLNFMQSLIDTQPLYAVANAQIPNRFKQIKEQNKSYLAHEYFNRDWHPMYYADMAKWLSPAKIEFACSTNFLDHVDTINLSDAQQQLMAGISDKNYKQTIRDYMVNQQFRKDYWIKGARPLDPLRQRELIAAQRIILTTPPEEVKLKVAGARGEATLHEEIYSHILGALGNHKPVSIGDLEKALSASGINFKTLLEAIILLTGLGHLYAAQDDEIIQTSLKATQKVNLDVITKTRSVGDHSYLASPVTGGGILVPRFQQLFLLALQQGRKQPQEWAAFVWDVLRAQNQSILKDGKALATPEENLAELNEQAAVFAQKQLPILKALLIA